MVNLKLKKVHWTKKKSFSEESRRKMSEAQKKRFSNPDEIRKLSERSKKMWSNPEIRKKQIEVRKGRHYSSKTEFKKGNVPWLKGKTGVYNQEQLKKMSEIRKGKTTWMKGKKHSKETKEKLSKWHTLNPNRYWLGKFRPQLVESTRIQILKQYESGNFPKQTNTKPERQIKEELIKRGYKEGLDFIHQYKFNNKFMCDFCFPKQKLIIEVDGDFWHVNPNKYPTGSILHKHQLKGIGRDKAKNAYIMKVDKGSWTLFRFWETDIKENVVKCVNKIEKVLAEKRI